MRIQQVKISNWMGIKDLEIAPGVLTILAVTEAAKASIEAVPVWQI